MRFIGSKKNIVGKIDDVLSRHLDGSEKTFLDLFAGSNSVGNYFSKKYQKEGAFISLRVSFLYFASQYEHQIF